MIENLICCHVERNITRLMFDKTGMLYEEPTMLLRQELREANLLAKAPVFSKTGASFTFA